MKIKDYLETLLENINISGMKGLQGKELKILEPYFKSIDELKDKKIQIIEELTTIGESSIEITSDGVSFKEKTEPILITINGVDGLKENIKLYSIYLQNDNVTIRCSENSIEYLDILLPSFDDIDDSGNYI